MQIDSKTLSELEIFRASDGTKGIFGLLDHTVTARGRAALRRRLETPDDEPDRIRQVQEAVRFFRDRPGSILFDDQTIQTVERYLGSNIETAATGAVGRTAELFWMSVRYRDLLREIRAGVAGTRALFRSIRRTIDLPGLDEAPAAVRARAEELAAIADRVLDGPPSSRNVLAHDRRYRRELRGDIRRALELTGQLDALAAMGRVASERDWCFPELVEGGEFLLEAEGLHHPFVAAPVRNPVRLTGGEPMVFLTGPNMAGKTTYLRSVALLVLLAQCGLPVPAEKARLTPVEHLFTSLRPEDDLKAGISFFLAEVMRVRAAASILAVGGTALVLFDEVFKGTNVYDALEASGEIIRGFAKARTSGFIFASHLSELSERLNSNPAIRFCRFEGEIVEGAPQFSYRLRDGASDQRFGMLLLREARIPELIARI